MASPSVAISTKKRVEEIVRWAVTKADKRKRREPTPMN